MASLPLREEPDISLSIVNSKARFDPLYICVRYTCIISPKCGSVLNTHSNDFIHMYIEHVTSCKRKNCFAVSGDGGVADEGRSVGVPKFYSWSKCTMSLTNIYSDWMSNASSRL